MATDAMDPQGLEHFTAVCRERGLPVTHQRRVIYRILAESREHPTPEEVFAAVRREIPTISLATVYKNLTRFLELGLLHEVASLKRPARFDANLEHHHHLVCTRCGKVLDLYDESLDSLRVSRDRLQGFVVQNIQVQVSGICSACREKDPSAPTPNNPNDQK